MSALRWDVGRERKTNFETEDFGLHERERFAVHFDKTFASLDEERSVEQSREPEASVKSYLAVGNGRCCKY